MITAQDTVLVCGATGRQGGAVTRELLRRGRPVRALVRDPDTPAAKSLAAAGATLVRADLDQPPTVQAAMHGAAGVFSVQTFRTSGGVAAEERQAITVADAAAHAGIAHLVYASVGSADRGTGVPQFESKGRIERHLHDLGLPATVLRPVFFMDNFAPMSPFAPTPVDGELVLTLALHPGTSLQMIATSDIGVFAADAFEHPDLYRGTTIEIAGDELTASQMAEVFGRVAGLPGRFQEKPVEQLSDDSYIRMFDWYNREGFRADLPALRRTHPHMETLESWLRRTGWAPSIPENSRS
jgi:uncharacterized protein YbjT (DUF2867 family)